MKKLIIFGIMIMMMIVPVLSNYVGEFQAGTYLEGDTVTYNGKCYAAVGTLSNIPASYHPESPWAHLWSEVNMDQCISLPEGSWVPNTQYIVGDVILYEDKYYEVRQTHTSQSDWKPDTVLSLYKPVINNNIVNYLPESYNVNETDFISYTEQEIINLMDYSFKESKLYHEGIVYTWMYFNPEPNHMGQIQWVYKPVNIMLSFDTINKCLDYYNLNTCVQVLIYDGIEYETDDELTESVTSIKEQAINQGLNQLNNIIQLQNKLSQEQTYNEFIVSDIQ